MRMRAWHARCVATATHWLWAVLIARIHEAFALVCVVCGGNMRLIAFTTEGVQIRQVPEHIGVDALAPRLAPARGPPLRYPGAGGWISCLRTDGQAPFAVCCACRSMAVIVGERYLDMTVRKRVSSECFCLWRAVVLALVLGLPMAAFAAPVAMVTDIEGTATITLAGKTQDATILTVIEAGSQLQLRAGATLTTLYLGAGNEFVFKGPALVTIRASGPEVLSGDNPQTRSPTVGKAVRIKPAGLTQAAVVMRSLSDNRRIRMLNFDATLILDRVAEFRWQGLAEEMTYLFELADDTGRMLHRGTAPSSAYTLPPELPLQDGASYRWTVSTSPSRARQTSTVGNFQMATAGLRDQVNAMRPDAMAPVSENVAYAAWLEQVDLKDEARKVWRALAAERPAEMLFRKLAQ